MTVEIKYKDLIDRCEQLSSFESEGKVDAAGQSRYLEIHINEVDKLLIMQYINQARVALEEKFARMLTESKDETIDTDVEVAKLVHEFDGIFQDSVIRGTNHRLDEGGIGFYEYPYDKEYSGFRYYRVGTDGGHIVSGIQTFPFIDFANETDVYLDKATGERYIWRDNELFVYSPEYTTVTSHIFTWTLRDDTRWNGTTAFTKHVSEAIVSYAMSAWLQDKLPDRAQFYNALFTASTEMATKNIFTKQAPKYE